MTDNSNNAGQGDSEGSDLMNMLWKYPVYTVAIALVGLYVISMCVFYQKDQDTDEKETWIEQSKAKEEEKQHIVTRTPSNSLAEKRATVSKKSVKESPERNEEVTEEIELQEQAPVKEKKKNQGKGKGKAKKGGAEAAALQQQKIEQAKALAAEKKMKQAAEAEKKENERKNKILLEAKKKQEQEKREKQYQIEEQAARQLLSKKNDMEFETQTGRVKIAKEIRKVRARKDSLDDHSSNSSSEGEYVPRQRRGRQTNDEEAENEKRRNEAKAEAIAQAEAELVEIKARQNNEAEKLGKDVEKQVIKKQKVAEIAPKVVPAKSVQKASKPKNEPKPAQKGGKQVKKTTEITEKKPEASKKVTAPAPTPEPKATKPTKTAAPAAKKQPVPEKRPPSPEYDEESDNNGTESYGSSYDENASSEDDENIIIKNVAKNSKMQFAPKGKKPPVKDDATLEQNAYQQLKAGKLKAQNAEPVSTQKFKEELIVIPAPEENGIKPKKGMKFMKKLAPKKKVVDKAGDWEVVEKRDAFLIERPVVTDSDAEDSDLSSD